MVKKGVLMTDTDELRRMLDERGVVWWPSDEPWNEGVITHWHAGPFKWTAIEGEDGLWLNAGVAGYSSLLPEQAIEATLGRGECENVAVEPYYFECSYCGHGLNFSNLFFCPICGRKVVSE